MPVEQGVKGDARPQRAGALVDPGEREPEGEQRHEDVELRMRDAEDGGRDAAPPPSPTSARSHGTESRGRRSPRTAAPSPPREARRARCPRGVRGNSPMISCVPGCTSRSCKNVTSIDAEQRQRDRPEEGLVRVVGTPRLRASPRRLAGEEPGGGACQPYMIEGIGEERDEPRRGSAWSTAGRCPIPSAAARARISTGAKPTASPARRLSPTPAGAGQQAPSAARSMPSCASAGERAGPIPGSRRRWARSRR